MCKLVPKLKHQSILGKKCVFGKKMDKYSVVVRNKGRVVAQSYNQEGGTYIYVTFAPILRL